MIFDAQSKACAEARPLCNNGVFSKAERVLTIAGWSEGVRRDIEIFRVVDQEGLTPLLVVLNESYDDQQRAAEEPSAI